MQVDRGVQPAFQVMHVGDVGQGAGQVAAGGGIGRVGGKARPGQRQGLGVVVDRIAEAALRAQPIAGGRGGFEGIVHVRMARLRRRQGDGGRRDERKFMGGWSGVLFADEFVLHLDGARRIDRWQVDDRRARHFHRSREGIGLGRIDVDRRVRDQWRDRRLKAGRGRRRSPLDGPRRRGALALAVAGRTKQGGDQHSHPDDNGQDRDQRLIGREGSKLGGGQRTDHLGPPQDVALAKQAEASHQADEPSKHADPPTTDAQAL